MVEKIRSYTTAPAQLLVCSSVHDPAEIESSLPGTAYSLALEEVRALYGSSSSAFVSLALSVLCFYSAELEPGVSRISLGNPIGRYPASLVCARRRARYLGI